MISRYGCSVFGAVGMASSVLTDWAPGFILFPVFVFFVWSDVIISACDDILNHEDRYE